MNITQKKTPNFWDGRKGYRPEAVVIHIMEGTLAGTDSWFASPASQVSAHYGIGKNGEVHQYVREADTAWHAGRVDAPVWTLIKSNVNPNLYTIGIEHEGKHDDTWTDALKEASATLISAACERWHIPIDRNHVIGHYEIDSKKPNCPAVDKSIIDELSSRATLKSGRAPAIVDTTAPVSMPDSNITLTHSSTMTKAKKIALKHFWIVFGYSAVSCILPYIIASLQKDMRWVILVPLINALWYATTRYLKEQRIIDDQLPTGEKGTV